MHDGKRLLLSQPVFPLALLVILLAIISVGILEERRTQINAAPVFDIAATSGTANVSVTIVDQPPSIFVTEPENTTYTNTTLNINISVVNLSSNAIDTTFYNLDDGENITLTLDSNNENVTTFNTTTGSHVITFFANDSTSALNSTSIAFTISQEESGEGGGGGGGGGGGIGAGARIGAATIIVYDLDTIIEQTDMIARISRIFFIWKGEEYSARVGKPSADTILFDFTDLGEKITLQEQQSMTIDLDNDGKADARLKIEEIQANFFTLTVTSLRVREQLRKVEQREEEPAKEEQGPAAIVKRFIKLAVSNDFVGIILLILLAIVFVVYARIRSKRKRLYQGKRF